MGRPHPLYSWSIIPIHFQLKTPKDERFLTSSFEMARSYIFPTYQIVLKWSKTDLSKIQIALFSKVLIENSSSLGVLTWKCILLVDQEQSGRGQPIWATPLPSKLAFYSIKQGNRSDFCPPLYVWTCPYVWICPHVWTYSYVRICPYVRKCLFVRNC